jgi:hypothetical protein
MTIITHVVEDPDTGQRCVSLHRYPIFIVEEAPECIGGGFNIFEVKDENDYPEGSMQIVGFYPSESAAAAVVYLLERKLPFEPNRFQYWRCSVCGRVHRMYNFANEGKVGVSETLHVYPDDPFIVHWEDRGVTGNCRCGNIWNQ